MPFDHESTGSEEADCLAAWDNLNIIPSDLCNSSNCLPDNHQFFIQIITDIWDKPTFILSRQLGIKLFSGEDMYIKCAA